MTPGYVFAAAGLGITMLGILWRFSSMLTALKLMLEELGKALHGSPAVPGVLTRMSLLESRVTTLETGDKVDQAVRARDEKSLQRRGVKETEYQHVDTSHLAKRKARKR